MFSSSIRSTYLITYSLADVSLVPSRKSFAEFVEEAFRETKKGRSELVYLACSREYHKNGGQHYHLSVKLS